MFSCFHLRKRNFADTVIYIPSFRAVFHSFPIQEYFCFLIIFHGKESSFQQSFCMNMEAQGQSMFESFHPVIGPWLCKRLHTKWISQLLTELIVNAENLFLRLPLPAVKSIFSQIQDTYIRLTADNLHLIGNIQLAAAFLLLTGRTTLIILSIICFRKQFFRYHGCCASRLQPEKKTVMIKHASFQNSVPFMVLCFYRINFTCHSIIYRHLPGSADTDAEFFFSWKILIFLTLLQFIDHDTGIGDLLCAVYMTQEQPAFFSLFSHLVDQVCGGFTVILKYLDISCLFHSFQQTVLTECHSLTLLCQLRTSV